MPNIQDYIDLGGWVDKPKTVNAVMQTLPMPLFCDVSSSIKDSSKGKTRLLYEYVEIVLGKGNFPVADQKTGDCVSHGAACAGTILSCVEIVLKGEFERFLGEFASEPIYGGSRVQIGNGELGYDEGSLGVWAAKWLNQYGSIIRKNYKEYGINLTKYDVNKAINWGKPNAGCPKLLINEAKDHLIKTVSQVRTFNECADALYNGFPVTVASMIGFNTVRDKFGRLFDYGIWPHQMCFIGVDNTDRPGLLCQNSWGRDWVSGPKRFESDPDGSFWIDAEIVDKMLSANDSWCFSNFQGFPEVDLDLRIV